ncbi:hypothetical protein GF326_08460 [Candidatus Bathyarchaeota archaeon]|nr:hypothetical protein [Candidatus Bathyarchaeota archaeon]
MLLIVDPTTYSMPENVLDKIGTGIGKQDHYKIMNSIKHVVSPTGQKMTGGFMNFVTVFNKKKQGILRNRETRVLVLPRVETGEIKLVASNLQYMNPDLFLEILTTIQNQPQMIKEFYLVGLQN